METTKDKITRILNEYNIRNITSMCKGMTLNEFQEFIVKRSKDFENEILSFKNEENEILQKYVDILSKIKIFHGKALNYSIYRDSRIRVNSEEKDILEEIYNSISR